MTALVAAMLAIIIDLIFRFCDYRELLHLRSVAGIIKFLGAITLVFLRVVTLFYLIILLPRPVRAVVLLLSAFIILIQLSYWRTLSQFMTAADIFLAVTVSGDHRVAAILRFFKPLVVLYAFPYALILSLPMILALRFDRRGQQGALLYERLSSWIRRLHGEEHTDANGCGLVRFETCRQ